MKILVYDSQYPHLKYEYDELASKSAIEFTRIFSLDELETLVLDEFDGMLAHPGPLGQKSFARETAPKYLPKLKIAIGVHGLGEYDTKSDDVPVFSLCNWEGIKEFFSKVNDYPKP